MRNAAKWRPIQEQSGPSTLWGVASLDDQGSIRDVIIRPSTRLDAEDADTIARAHNARLSRPDQIFSEAIVSHRTGEPAFHFAFGDVTWEMGLRELRTWIDDLQQLAEAGLTDAFIVKFMRKMIPAGDEEKYGSVVGVLMQEFRQFREELRAPVVDAEQGPAS
jgi:hypothetical protein